MPGWTAVFFGVFFGRDGRAFCMEIEVEIL
jgi:hypothetical protein